MSLLLALGACATGEAAGDDTATLVPSGGDAATFVDANAQLSDSSAPQQAYGDAGLDAASSTDASLGFDSSSDAAQTLGDAGHIDGSRTDAAVLPDAGTYGPDSGAGGSDATVPTADASPDALSDAGGLIDGAVTDSSVSTDASATDAAADGSPVSPVVLPVIGDVVISEVMFNPSDSVDSNGEWFELYNSAPDAKLLNGLTLTDGDGRTDTIPSTPPLIIPAGAYVILAHNKLEATTTDGIPTAAIVYEYATLQLANGSTGGISLSNGTAVLASVPYGPWGKSVNGASIQGTLLTPAAEGTSADWCVSTKGWAGGDLGSPGAPANCP